MQEPKQLVQRKIRQVVFLYVQHITNLYGPNNIDQNKHYQRIYAQYQAGLITFADIEYDINMFLKELQKDAE